jgi:hypothetical protein
MSKLKNKILKWLRQTRGSQHKIKYKFKMSQPKSTVTWIKSTNTGTITINKKNKIHILMDLNTKIIKITIFSIIVYQTAGFLAVIVIECLIKIRVITSHLVSTAKNQRIYHIKNVSKWILWEIESTLSCSSNKRTRFRHKRKVQLQRNLTKNIFSWCHRMRTSSDALK